MPPTTVEPVKLDKGAEIRAKVAENRVRRLNIAETMKREAGVTGHEVYKESYGGLAYIAVGLSWIWVTLPIQKRTR